jgi:hypothetical protein
MRAASLRPAAAKNMTPLPTAAAAVALANCVISVLLEVLRSNQGYSTLAAARPQRIFTKGGADRTLLRLDKGVRN